MNKRLKVLGVFALAVGLIAATSALVTTMTVVRFGPFYTSQVAFDSLAGGQPGGRGIWANVGGTTDTLLVGDVVYWSDTNRVTKSATLALYNSIAGVVVGGARTSSRTSVVAADVGSIAGTTGQRVFLLKNGRTWMKSSNNAAIIAGRRILPSDSIAGRFDTTLTAQVIDSANRMIGRTVTAAPALSTVLVDVSIR